MNKEEKKSLIGGIALVLALVLPATLLIIFQLTQGIISFVNIIVAVIVGFLIATAIKTNLGKNKHKTNASTNNAKTDYTAGVEDKYKIANANTSLKTQPVNPKLKIVSKVLCLVFAVVFVGLAILSWSLMVNKYKGDDYTLYDATVVSIEDKTSYETSYDEIDGTYTVAEYDKCEVTFRYFDGDGYKMVKKTFNNVRVVPTSDIRIYVKDEKVVATEYSLVAGRVLTFWLIMLATMNIIMFFFNIDIMLLIVCEIFVSCGAVFAFSMSVHPLAMLYVEYGSIIALLCPVGFLAFGLGIYQSVQEKKGKKRVNNER